MASFIDRDPEHMMKYASEAKSIIGEMVIAIRKIQGLLDSYSKDLDEPTQKQIEKLHQCCNEYFKQIEVYQKIADDVYSKGKRLSEVRNGG